MNTEEEVPTNLLSSINQIECDEGEGHWYEVIWLNQPLVSGLNADVISSLSVWQGNRSLLLKGPSDRSALVCMHWCVFSVSKHLSG